MELKPHILPSLWHKKQVTGQLDPMAVKRMNPDPAQNKPLVTRHKECVTG